MKPSRIDCSGSYRFFSLAAARRNSGATLAPPRNRQRIRFSALRRLRPLENAPAALDKGSDLLQKGAESGAGILQKGAESGIRAIEGLIPR
jgi:hypothetical protein